MFLLGMKKNRNHSRLETYQLIQLSLKLLCILLSARGVWLHHLCVTFIASLADTGCVCRAMVRGVTCSSNKTPRPNSKISPFDLINGDKFLLLWQNLNWFSLDRAENAGFTCGGTGAIAFATKRQKTLRYAVLNSKVTPPP
jgi:hypothetical protein